MQIDASREARFQARPVRGWRLEVGGWRLGGGKTWGFMFMVFLGLEKEVTHASKMAGEGLLLDSEETMERVGKK
jgi:hypothetical protein